MDFPAIGIQLHSFCLIFGALGYTYYLPQLKEVHSSSEVKNILSEGNNLSGYQVTAQVFTHLYMATFTYVYLSSCTSAVYLEE